MIATLLIAIAAGLASALMFASIISGALVSLLLFYLAPLPLMVAALGWGPFCAAVGGITATCILGLTFGLPYCAAFVLAIALPAWWLGHLALLGRPRWSTGRKIAMLTLRGYLLVSVILLIVKAVQLTSVDLCTWDRARHPRGGKKEYTDGPGRLATAHDFCA